MPTERVRRGIADELAAFRRDRRLALAAGLAVGAAALVAGASLVALEWRVAGSLLVGASGTTYYSLYYGDRLPDEAESFEREVVRSLAVGWLLFAAVPDGAAVLEAAVHFTAYGLVLTLVAASTAVQVRDEAA